MRHLAIAVSLAATAALAQTYTFTPFAGGGPGAIDGIGADARFNAPESVGVDGAGNVYVADEGNDTIRKVTRDGVVTTVAGLAGDAGWRDGFGASARIYGPAQVAVDRSGIVYVRDSSFGLVRKITPDGAVTTVAHDIDAIAVDRRGNLYVFDRLYDAFFRISGTTTQLTGNVRGALGSAEVLALAADDDGNVFAITSDNAIWKLSADGSFALFSGKQYAYGLVDGPADKAQFSWPYALAADQRGNLYVADSGNGALRKVARDGSVSTIAIRSFDGSKLQAVHGVAVDDDGTLFIADAEANAIRTITPSGFMTTLAGSGGGEIIDGTGTSARFLSPTAITADCSGNLYVDDDTTIRRISFDAAVTTIARSFSEPYGLAADCSGNVYIADRGRNVIDRITANGSVSTIAGVEYYSGREDGHGTAARFELLSGLTLGADGNLYATDFGMIRRITPTGDVTTVGWSDDSEPGDFTGPQAIATDASGDFYIADSDVRKIDANGTVTTLASEEAQSVAVDAQGNVFFTKWPYHELRMLAKSGGISTAAEGFDNPAAIASDKRGRLWMMSGQEILKGVPSLPDRATIDAATGLIGVTRQLGTTTHDAQRWQWTMIRRPATSHAELSSTTTASPTFTPDVADLYVFRLTATDGTRASVTDVALQVVPVAKHHTAGRR